MKVFFKARFGGCVLPCSHGGWRQYFRHDVCGICSSWVGNSDDM